MNGMTTGSIVNLGYENAMEKINKMPILRQPMKAEDLAIRIPRLIGNQETVSHGKLKDVDLPLFANLCVGIPVLVGHQKDTRPIARVFDAYVADNYVFSPFYFPLARADATDLLLDIDTGVIAEVSASFAFDKPLCSVCELDMRSVACGHVPGKEGNFFWYDTIQKVLEESLVYRGGHPNTGFVHNLYDDPEWSEKFHKLLRPEEGLASFIDRYLKKTDRKQLYQQIVETLDLSTQEVVSLLADGKPPKEALPIIASRLNVSIDLLPQTENLQVPGLQAFVNRCLESKGAREYGPTRLQMVVSIASRTNMAPSDVERWLTATKVSCPSVEFLRGLARVLNCDVNPLIQEAIKDGCKYPVRAIKTEDGYVYREVSDAQA